MKRFVLTFCILFAIFDTLSAADKPVVISLSAVGDYSKNADFESSLALRPQIVTRLVRNYDCIVLSRSVCDSMALESDIQRFAAIANTRSYTNQILAADYAIRVFLYDDQTAAETRVVILMQDLRKDIDVEPVRISWTAPKSSRVDEQTVDSISEKIATHLSLKAKSKEGHSRHIPGGGTWAVLPFYRTSKSPQISPVYQQLCTTHDDGKVRMPAVMRELQLKDYALTGKGNTNPKWLAEAGKRYEDERLLAARFLEEGYVAPITGRNDQESAHLAEQVLLEAGQGLTIVDRASVNKTLAEMQITSMQGFNENMGGRIARLMGADRLLIGSLLNGSSGVVVTIHLVDAAISSVLAAAEVTVSDEAGVSAAIPELVSNLIKDAPDLHNLPVSPKWQREREAAFYEMEVDNETINVMFRKLQYNRVQICYLLRRDDADYILKTIVPLLALFPDLTKTDPDLAHSAAFLFDQITSQFDHSASYPCPLLHRADAFARVLEWRRALMLAREHLKKHPAIRPDWAKYLEARCLYWLGEKKQAAELGKAVIELLEKRPEGVDLNPCRCEYDSRCSQNQWQADIEGQTLTLLLSIAQDDDIRDEELEYFVLKRWRRTDSARLRYVMLTKKLKGAEAAISLCPLGSLKKTPTYEDQTNVILDMLAAEYLTELGRHEEASAIYEGVVRNWSKLNKFAAAQAKKLLQEMGKKAVAVDPGQKLYRNAAEIMPFPEQYKIYCFPVQGVNSNVLMNACKRIGSWFGTDVVVKPELSFPAGTFDAKRGVHDFHAFSRQLLQNAKVPSDAVFVLFLTHANLSNANVLPTMAPIGSSILLVSHYRRQEDIVRMVIDWGYCPCIQKAPPLDWLGWALDFESRAEYGCSCTSTAGPGPWIRVCEHCAAGYKNQLEQTHKALQNFLTRKHKMLTLGRMELSRYSPVEYSWVNHIDWTDESTVKQLIADANKGDLSAGFKVALLYRGGFGVVGDEKKAEEMFKTLLPDIKKAAEASSAEDQCNLGLMFQYGFGVPLNHGEALRYYLMAAQQGLPRAQHYAGTMYQTAQGTEKDISSALQWYRLPESKNYADTYYALGSMNDSGIGQISDHRAAMEYYQKAAEKGHADAMHRIGELYEEGKGVSRDIGKAAEWYRKAAENGSANGLMSLSSLYEQKKISEQ